MKFDLNNMGTCVIRPHTNLLPAGNVRLFSKAITGRLRRVGGSNPRGFLSSQFGNRFGSVNTRSRAGERVYKQPGRFFQNTTIKSITELFMSFKTSQFVQPLRFVLNELRGKDNVMLSRSSDRHELRSESSTAVSMLYEIQQPRFDYFQAITRNALSQLALVTPTTQQFQCETFAPFFAFTKTQLKSENYGRYLTSLQQSTAGPGRSAVTHGQTIVYTMGMLSSAHKLTPMQNAPLGRPERQLVSTHSNREFQLVTPGSQVMNERSLITLISQHRDRSEPSIVVNRSSSAMTFSANAKRIDSQRFQKLLSTMGGSLVRQSNHVTLMNRSKSWFARFLNENSLFNDSQVSKFISRYRTIETDRSRQEVAERTFARKDAGRPAPSNDFVFAQAHRQEPADERVVKKIEARQIVEIVRKELTQSMNAVTPLWNFTRRDYEEIGDQVYSSLVRRLTIERERLGLT